MKYTPGILREVLHSLIRKLGETPEQFVRQPGRDFTRPRTLSFETVISLLLTMSENSVGKVLIKRFKKRGRRLPRHLSSSGKSCFHQRWRRFSSGLRPACAPQGVFRDTVCWQRTDPT